MGKPCCIDHWTEAHPGPPEGSVIRYPGGETADARALWDGALMDLRMQGIPQHHRHDIYVAELSEPVGQTGGNTTWTATSSGVIGLPVTAWGGGGGSGGENGRLEDHPDMSFAGTEPGRLPDNHGYNWHRHQWETTGDEAELAKMLEYPLPPQTEAQDPGPIWMETEKQGVPRRVVWGVLAGVAAFWVTLAAVVTVLVVFLG